MKRIAFTFLFLFTFLPVAFSGLPNDAKVVECEDFTTNDPAWMLRTHEPGAWYAGKPSGNSFLGGQNKTQGTASVDVQILKAGKYRLWVRYLDMVNYREKNGFQITAKQITNGETTTSIMEFDASETSLRATPEGEKLWGDGFARWVWAVGEFDAQPGTVTLELSKIHTVPVHGCARDVDVVILTEDTQYVPDIVDLYPLYVRIRVLPEQTKPIGIHIFGKHPYSPYYPPHSNITRQGHFLGINTGLEKSENLMGPGDTSPWVNVSPLLAFGGRNQVRFYAMREYSHKEPTAFFEISFSRTPDESGILKTVQRRGSGDGIFWSVDLMDFDSLNTELDASARNLERARNVGAVPGRCPTIYPFFTGMALNPLDATPQAFQNETEALHTIGLAKTLFRPSCFYFHATKPRGCLASPDRELISQIFRDGAKHFLEASSQTDFTNVVALNAMDEPGFDFSHISSCENCQAAWGKYLESLGMSSSELTLNNDPNGTTLAERKSYYYTRRFLNHLMTEMLRAGTQCAADPWNDVPVTVNFATEVVSGNMVSRGLDWFEIFDTGALTYGWSEDWGGWNRTFQINGYMCDALRASCRRSGVDFGMYNILCGRSSWEIQAKGFMEIGHGVRAMSFFNYGPDYAISSDTNSERPEIYEAIKRLTFAAGAVETALMNSRPARADAAQLHSVTGEIWHANGDYAGGRERVDLNLLLRHCGISCDVIGEDDLLDENSQLQNYPVLFASDTHLRRACVPALVSWVKNGGILYASPGALEFDEFAQPLGLWEALGVTREKFELVEEPGRPLYEMQHRKELANIAGIRAFCGTQGEPCTVTACGNGRVFCVGFFPAISYDASAVVVPQNVPTSQKSILDFPSEHRVYMQEILTQMGLNPRLRTSDPRIEANLLESPQTDVLALSNWTGEPREVEITLENAPEYRSIAPVCGTLISQTRTGTQLTIRVRIPAGDFISCEK